MINCWESVLTQCIVISSVLLTQVSTMAEWFLLFVRARATEDVLRTMTFSTQVCRGSVFVLPAWSEATLRRLLSTAAPKNTQRQSRAHRQTHKDTSIDKVKHTGRLTKTHRETKSSTQTDSQRHTHRQSQAHRQTHKDTQRQSQAHRQTHKDTHRDKVKHTDRLTDSQRHTQRQSQAHRQTHKDMAFRLQQAPFCFNITATASVSTHCFHGNAQEKIYALQVFFVHLTEG